MNINIKVGWYMKEKKRNILLVQDN